MEYLLCIINSLLFIHQYLWIFINDFDLMQTHRMNKITAASTWQFAKLEISIITLMTVNDQFSKMHWLHYFSAPSLSVLFSKTIYITVTNVHLKWFCLQWFWIGCTVHLWVIDYKGSDLISKHCISIISWFKWLLFLSVNTGLQHITTQIQSM